MLAWKVTFPLNLESEAGFLTISMGSNPRIVRKSILKLVSKFEHNQWFPQINLVFTDFILLLIYFYSVFKKNVFFSKLHLI